MQNELLNENIVYSVFFKEGFFGYGDPGDFKTGTLAHFVPIILTILIVYFIKRYADKIRNFKYKDRIEYALIALMLFAEASYWCRLIYVGPGDLVQHNMLNKMPLQVCQWTLIITVFALITKSKMLFNMAFYLTTLPTLLAVVIVEVISTTGPTYFRYYQFWLEHQVPVIAVYYMLFVNKQKPKLKYVIHTITFLSLMFIVSVKADALLSEGVHKYMYKDYVNMIPMFKNAGTVEIFFILLISFSIAFIFVYFVYKYLVEKQAQQKHLEK